MIATTSEDQTCKLWRIIHHTNQYELVSEISKHSLAVTSVDWQLMSPELGNVVACCSDDQVFRAFRYTDDKHIDLISELNFSYLKEFFTLTYLGLEKGGSLIAVSSQIGHVFIYDLAKKMLLFQEKVHLGGIEGLAIHSKRVFTCSSDNCLIMTEIEDDYKTDHSD